MTYTDSVMLNGFCSFCCEVDALMINASTSQTNNLHGKQYDLSVELLYSVDAQIRGHDVFVLIEERIVQRTEVSPNVRRLCYTII